MAVLQRQAQLDGLDAPTRVEIGPTDLRFEELVQAMLHARCVAPVIEAGVVEFAAVMDADEVTDEPD